MRISDWSSDVCSSDLPGEAVDRIRSVVEAIGGKGGFHRGDGVRNLADDPAVDRQARRGPFEAGRGRNAVGLAEARGIPQLGREIAIARETRVIHLDVAALAFHRRHERSEEHTSEPQSQMRTSYAVF